MIWDSYHTRRNQSAQSSNEKAKRKADRFSEDIADLRQHTERLSLACQAMWELLRDFSDLTEEHIENKILEIDARDGKADGRMSPQLLDCWECGRPTNSSRRACVMCGAPIDRPHQFGA